MDPTVVVRANWLTRKPSRDATWVTLLLALVLTGAARFSDLLNATPHEVFDLHQYWRAWTALFAHADLGHLLSNSIVLVPLGYFLAGYYGYLFFPVLGLVTGGLTNLLVLKTMNSETALLGISGVVNWMGAAWLTLFVIIDRRESLRRRLAVAICLTMMLFVPDTFRPEVSYLSHLIGFVFGVASAFVYYRLNRATLESAEVRETVYDDIEEPLDRVLS